MEEATSEFPERKEFRPKGITCPEGIWVPEAAIQLAQKEKEQDWNKQSSDEGIQNLIIFLLKNPELEAFSIDSLDGFKAQIDRDYLRSKPAIRHFKRGFKPFSSDFHVSDTDGYFFFLDKEQFENLLAGEPIVDPPETQQQDGARLSYIPPYMEFMLKAVAALNLSKDKRTEKNTIVYWLKENWPDNLGEQSDHLIGSMATILRRPQDKFGGSTPWKNSSEK